MQHVWTFSKLVYQICKTEAVLELLTICRRDGLAPKFLNIKLTNSNLQCSKIYKQTLLFKLEMKPKTSIVARQKKDLVHVKNILKDKVSTFDFVHIPCLFLVWTWKSSEFSLQKPSITRIWEQQIIPQSKGCGSQLFVIQIIKCWKEVLSRGFSNALPPTKFNYKDHVLSLALLGDITTLQLCKDILDRLKVELNREPFLSFGNHSFLGKVNITKEEHCSIKDLSSYKEILIQKSDKENSFV